MNTFLQIQSLIQVKVEEYFVFCLDYTPDILCCQVGRWQI